jgi:hypothetical protein
MPSPIFLILSLSDLPHPELVEGRTIELPRAEQRAL